MRLSTRIAAVAVAAVAVPLLAVSTAQAAGPGVEASPSDSHRQSREDDRGDRGSTDPWSHLSDMIDDDAWDHLSDMIDGDEWDHLSDMIG